ncbi:AAA family ATPase [[Clostridium] innocuum]|nr:AAA family ATPase [[Clostridium] innocuum]
MVLRLATLLSKGEALPYDDTEREPVRVIYQTSEDGLEDTIKPRLESAEADCTQIKVIDESEAALSMLDERIEKAIIEVSARVLILDPIQAYVGANINMNNANEVRNVMAQLGRGAEKYDCAILLVGHMNKGSRNKSSYRGLGSIDFQTSARSVLRLSGELKTILMVQDKSSLALEGEAIAFELDKENGFSWLGHYDISVDDLLSGIPKEMKSEQAENLILEYL